MKNEPEIVKTMRDLEKKENTACSSLTKLSINNSLSKEIVTKSLKGILRKDILEGNYINKFENSIKDFFGTKHAISTSSARMAFYLILKALNLRKGDEIIIPAYMLPILPQISEFFGLKPVFADIDPYTLNIDPNDVEKKITKKTKIILLVHLYGLPCDINRISELASKNNIIIIEDCAQAFGAKYKDKKVGTFGDAAYLSFNDSKNLNTFGGGMVLTNNDTINSKIRDEIKKFGYPNKYEIRKKLLKFSIFWILFTPFIFSYLTYPFLRILYFLKKDYIKNFWVSEQVKNLKNIAEEDFLKKCAYRYTNMQAYLGLNGLKNFEKINSKLIKNANFLYKNLKEISPKNTDGRTYFRYCIIIEFREELWHKLFKSGIFTAIGSYLVLPDLEMFKEHHCVCPNSQKVSKELIYIPIQPYFKKSHMVRMLKVLQEYEIGKKL